MKKILTLCFIAAIVFVVKAQIAGLCGITSDWNKELPDLSEPGVFPFTTVNGMNDLTNYKVCSNPVEVRNVFKTVIYSGDDTKFPNPERGFYKELDCDLGSGRGALNETTLKSYRNSNITLILRMYYLKDFKSVALSAKVLADFDADMAAIRKSGIKCILRFAYSEQETEADAPFNIISQHLDQLKPYFEKNADVIAILQAGFIGAWGEWYYSTNKLNTTSGRSSVLNKILQTMPVRRMVQVRTPSYKRDIFQRSTPLISEEAFSIQNVARVGHHNDCFMASSTDYGTYKNATVDKAYLNEECLYVPIGGETCPPSGIDPADATKAQNEMRYLRWTYLHQDYYRGVNDQWITQGGMDNIIRELGYRFQLISGEYTDNIAQGDSFSTRILIKNLGYAPLFNPRGIELVFKNSHSNELFKMKLIVDPRQWKPLVENLIEATVGIPQEMPVGEYALYLNLPDPESTLYGNPDYSIRLANQNVWEAVTGFNNLGVNIQVSTKTSDTNISDTNGKIIKIWNETNTLIIQSTKACDIAIYTTLGEQVAKEQGIMYKKIILPTGIYLISLLVEGQKVTKKIIINK